jgi:proteasome lid subunit RPN8/RPN11
MRVRISRVALDAIVMHARDLAPAECCGLLLGMAGSVTEAAPTANIADDRRSRFVIDPKDHIDARRTARARGLEVVGFYHSHPRSPAVPSETDRDEATYPDHLYLIVSLAGERPELGLFKPDASVQRGFLPIAYIAVG